MSSLLPIPYLHKIESGAKPKRLTVESTHPGVMIINENGDKLIEGEGSIVLGTGPAVDKRFLLDIPYLCYINKDGPDTFTIKFGHEGAEHRSHAAIVNVRFHDEEAISHADVIPTDLFPAFARSSGFVLDPATAANYRDPAGVYEGNVDIRQMRYLSIVPYPKNYATVTIASRRGPAGNGLHEDEMNCHVLLISAMQSGAYRLDPESTLGEVAESFTFPKLQGYWIAPFIVPKVNTDNEVVFEIGDPEPNAKIIIDDA